MNVVQFYGLVVHALWFAPIYAWLLLVSAWARRLVILWALLPVVVLGMGEKLTFGTQYMCTVFQHRVMGAYRLAFSPDTPHGGHVLQLSQLEPVRFFTSFGLWAGLAVAALFLLAAARLRRSRGPI
jgi:ABC-2 type transport system permease protein